MIPLDFFILKYIYTFISRWEDKWSFICCSHTLFTFLFSFSEKEISYFHETLFKNNNEIARWFHYINNEDWHGLDYLEFIGFYDMYPKLTEIGLVYSVELINYKLVYYMLRHNARNIEGAVYRLKHISNIYDDENSIKQICRIYYWLLFYQNLYWQESNLKFIL